FPFTQVEIPLTVASTCGSTCRIVRPFVHISKLQPTLQYVQTVLVRLIRDFLIAASTSEIAKISLYPGSTSFVRSIIGSRIFGGILVKKPASPNIDFYIKALQGQTVTQ